MFQVRQQRAPVLGAFAEAVDQATNNPGVNLPHKADGLPSSAGDVPKADYLRDATVMEVTGGADGRDIVNVPPCDRLCNNCLR